MFEYLSSQDKGKGEPKFYLFLVNPSINLKTKWQKLQYSFERCVDCLPLLIVISEHVAASLVLLESVTEATGRGSSGLLLMNPFL